MGILIVAAILKIIIQKKLAKMGSILAAVERLRQFVRAILDILIEICQFSNLTRAILQRIFNKKLCEDLINSANYRACMSNC